MVAVLHISPSGIGAPVLWFPPILQCATLKSWEKIKKLGIAGNGPE